MSETTDKLAIQHKVIGAKTNCKYFSNIGNLCSRVENGMMRCDEYLECEFKYIDALKEENEKLKQYLLNIAMIIEELEQQYDDIKDFTEIKEIKEILSEVNK